MNIDFYVEEFFKYKPNKIFDEGTQGQRLVIRLLEDGDKTITELSNMLDVSTARMAVIVNTLEKDMKVQRIKGMNDKRITYVHLTEKGYDEIIFLKNHIKERIKEAINILGEEEFNRFVDDLYKLVRNRGTKEC
jgi:DNA-binding MarR family transcriptional regulator